jgi:dTDP-4-dehydrorhamnose reductase
MLGDAGNTLSNDTDILPFPWAALGQPIRRASRHGLQSVFGEKALEKSRRILVSGGAGYIGAHTVRLLLAAGHEVTVVDNLSKGYRHNVPVGRLVVLDIAETARLADLMREREIEAVIHFAAFIAVGESMKEPARYFTNNVAGSLSLLSAMVQAGVRHIVFSSTAAVYGEPDVSPIPETTPIHAVNPYGESIRKGISARSTNPRLIWSRCCCGRC